MKWSFCICFNNPEYLSKQILSIKNQEGIQSQNYQVILIGPETSELSQIVSSSINDGVDLLFIPFDDTSKQGWTTKKKNTCVHMAKHQNVVISHDYISLCEGWYKNFELFGDDWQVCMNPIRFPDGKRFRDWIRFREWWGSPEFVSYDDLSQTQNMYVSGTYWCAKKDYMLHNPLNEALRWGQGEDLEWSHRCRHTWKYRMNKNSVVKMLKEKRWNGEMDYSPHPDTDPNISDIISSKIQE